MFRCTATQMGFVNFPRCTGKRMYCSHDEGKVPPEERFCDTKEGGIEVWLIMPKKYTHSGINVRSVCMTGFEVGVVYWDAVPQPLRTYFELFPSRNASGRVLKYEPILIDGAICIGASGQCPWDNERKEYWRPTFDDLTEEGKTLFKFLETLYDAEPILSAVIDT